MPKLVLVRHGKSEWTTEKRFSGWGDAPLSQKGRDEAQSAGKTLKLSGYLFDVCFTSRLIRAKDTSHIILDELGLSKNKLEYKWRLNERHYGALQGELRADMRQKHGKLEVVKWRNNYRAEPPKLTDDDPRWQEQLERFPDVPEALHPRSESMMQAVQRTKIMWSEDIAPALKAEKSVLVIAHTNSIRALVGCVEDLTESQSAGFRISTAVPRLYELDENLRPLQIRDITKSSKAKIHHWAIRKKMALLEKSQDGS